MPENDTTLAAQQATSTAPAPSPSQSEVQSQDDGYDPQWMTKLTPRHKSDLEEFSKTLPAHRELESAKASIARREKWGNATRDEIERILDNESELGEAKQLLISLGIATKDDLEDLRTHRELRIKLSGRKASAPATPGSKDGEENPFFSQLDAWAKSRGIPVPDANPRSEADGKWKAPGNGARGTGAQSYKDILKSGKPLPSAAEIDAQTARFLQGR